jgi:hypothetical protein
MATVTEKKGTPEKVELNGIAKDTEKGKALSEILNNVKQPTATERIKRAEQFAILSERYEQLTNKKIQLEKFLIADDGTQGCTLSLKSSGKLFEIANSAVIKEVLTFAKTKLNSLIEITEAEVLHFTI